MGENHISSATTIEAAAAAFDNAKTSNNLVKYLIQEKLVDFQTPRWVRQNSMNNDDSVSVVRKGGPASIFLATVCLEGRFEQAMGASQKKAMDLAV
jgi:hypothetical protein